MQFSLSAFPITGSCAAVGLIVSVTFANRPPTSGSKGSPCHHKKSQWRQLRLVALVWDLLGCAKTIQPRITRRNIFLLYAATVRGTLYSTLLWWPPRAALFIR